MVATAATVLVMTAYMLYDAPRLARGLYLATPEPRHPQPRELLRRQRKAVGGYIRGQATVSATITVYTFVMLTVLRVPNPLALAVFTAIAAIADCIPVVGVFVLIVPPAVAGLTTVSVPVAIIIAGLMVLATVVLPNAWTESVPHQAA